jgi:hypothetical protein
MNQDSENFEQLRRLLALKRHEQPPPGYFNNFSRQVCARIQAGEGANSNFGWLMDLRRFWAAFETKPVLAGAVGLASCVFLLAGIVYSTEQMDAESQAVVALPIANPNLGLPSSHVAHASVFEAPALASFQLNNNLANSAYPGSLLPVQQVNFILPEH